MPPYSFLSKSSKIDTAEQPAKPFFFSYPPWTLANLRATLSLKRATPKTHQIKKIEDAKQLKSYRNGWECDQSILPLHDKENICLPLTTLLFKWSNVKTLSQVASHEKKLTLGGTQEFQMTATRKFKGPLNCKTLYKALTKNLPLFSPTHTNLSSSFLLTLHFCNLKKNLSTISASQSLSLLEKRGA